MALRHGTSPCVDLNLSQTKNRAEPSNATDVRLPRRHARLLYAGPLMKLRLVVGVIALVTGIVLAAVVDTFVGGLVVLLALGLLVPTARRIRSSSLPGAFASSGGDGSGGGTA